MNFWYFERVLSISKGKIRYIIWSQTMSWTKGKINLATLVFCRRKFIKYVFTLDTAFGNLMSRSIKNLFYLFWHFVNTEKKYYIGWIGGKWELFCLENTGANILLVGGYRKEWIFCNNPSIHNLIRTVVYIDYPWKLLMENSC